MQHENKVKKERPYGTGKLTLLGLMTVLAITGILATWVLRQFLVS